jgi:hypothetical protein
VIASNTLDHIGLTSSSVRSSIGVLDGIFIDVGLAFSQLEQAPVSVLLYENVLQSHFGVTSEPPDAPWRPRSLPIVRRRRTSDHPV